MLLLLKLRPHVNLKQLEFKNWTAGRAGNETITQSFVVMSSVAPSNLRLKDGETGRGR